MIENKKRSIINVGHKFNTMGGPKVVAAYFGLYIFLKTT